MPTWTIRTRDDNGKDEKIKVRAKDAGEAIALAEVDMRNVIAIRPDWVEGMEKGYGKSTLVRSLALKAAILYFMARLFTSSPLPTAQWSDATITVKVLSVVLVLALVIASLLYARRKTKNMGEEEQDAAEIIDRSEIKTALWFTTGMAWVFLVFGVMLGVSNVIRENGGNELFSGFSEGLLLILAFFAIAWFDPHDPL